jgi:hypothetical protein
MRVENQTKTRVREGSILCLETTTKILVPWQCRLEERELVPNELAAVPLQVLSVVHQVLPAPQHSKCFILYHLNT